MHDLKDILRLRPWTRHLRVRVLGGPNKGLVWSAASSGRFLRGRFETPRIECLLSLMRPGDVFWDLGAHQGYVTMAAARRVLPGGRVYSFEPNPKNQWYLRHHVAWNRMGHVAVHGVAIGERDGEAAFATRGTARGHLGNRGGFTVPVRSVDSLVASGECLPPALMKADIEGAEIDMLRGAEKTLRGAAVVLVLSVHSSDLKRRAIAILEDYGYQVHEPHLAMPEGDWDGLPNPDPDILAVGPGRTVSAESIELFRKSAGGRASMKR